MPTVGRPRAHNACYAAVAIMLGASLRAGGAAAQGVPPQGSGGVTIEGDDSEYRERVSSRTFRHRNKDGTFEEWTYEERFSDLWVSRTSWRGNVTWSVVPSGQLSFSGTIGGEGTYAFAGPLGRGTQAVSQSGSFTATVNATTGAFEALIASWQGASYDLLDGRAETGPWTVRLDTTVPVVGSLNFATGAFTASFGYLLFAPNVSLDGGDPIPFLETVTGQLAVIPEPATLWLFGAGAVGLLALSGVRRRDAVGRAAERSTTASRTGIRSDPSSVF